MFSKNVVRSLAGMGLMAALLFISPVLTTQAAEVTSTVVSTTATVKGSALKIRQNASNGATVIGIASNGESFTVTGVVDNEWLSVSYKGRTAYIASDFVTLKTVKTQVVTVVEEEETEEAVETQETVSEDSEFTAEQPAETTAQVAQETVTVQQTAAASQTCESAPSTGTNEPAQTVQTQQTLQTPQCEPTESQEILLSEQEGEEPEETEEAFDEETDGSATEAETVAEETVEAMEENSSESEVLAEAPAETEETGEQEIADEAVPAAFAYSEEDLKMLAALIYCEAVGESYEGKLAVGEVVLNRVASSRYPDSVSGVIYDAGQFTPVSTGKFARILANGVTDEACLQAAAQALAGSETIGGCTRFNRVKASSQGTIIGNHVFWG